MKNSLLLFVIFGTACVFALPKRCAENEDCYDNRLHPDLPSEPLEFIEDNVENLSSYWLDKGKLFVQDQVKRQLNKKQAKNVILFLGDGMGLTTIAGTRVYIGGEEKQLSFEKFPYTGLSKTYCVDKIVPDSATTSTSYLCGVKSNYGTIGVNAHITRGDCVATRNESNYVYSIGKWAMDAGKSAGLVTTTRVTHASPAGMYAHVADREWENDSEMKKDCGENSGVKDIATQLIHGDVGSRLKVMMGGGKTNFIGRSDGVNLIEDYQNQSKKNAFVQTRTELMNFKVKSADRLLGIFHDSHLSYNLEAIDEHLDQPTLEDMTKRAIEFMEKDKNGYFLFVEGGRIDMAHHDNEAKLSMDETDQFSKAIKRAREMTSEEDTLIIVTADHSHAFAFAGYASRGRKITEKAGTADDNLAYMSFSYANGPSFKNYYDTIKKERIDPTSISKSAIHAQWPATTPLDLETHGGDDVGVFASGPWAHLFTGVYDQNTIPHMLAYASCVGDGLKACDK